MNKTNNIIEKLKVIQKELEDGSKSLLHRAMIYNGQVPFTSHSRSFTFDSIKLQNGDPNCNRSIVSSACAPIQTFMVLNV